MPSHPGGAAFMFGRIRKWHLVLLGLAVIAVGSFLIAPNGGPAVNPRFVLRASEGGTTTTTTNSTPSGNIVIPEVGGLDRTTTQPGTLEAFEFADLYSKVSGFL